jgi:hypothetical protein
MTPARKEKCSIRHGYDAMNRIEEAGLLIGALLKDQPGTGRDAYHLAYMDFQMETVEIAHQMHNRHSPETVRAWIEPKRDALLAELQRRGLDQSADARHAFRKIDAVLSWVDDWERMASALFTTTVPLLFGTLLGLGFGYALIPAIVVGSLLASHTLLSVPIVQRLGVIRLEPIVVTIGATVLSDTLSLIVFAVCVSTYTTGFSPEGLAIQLIEIAVFVPLILIGLSRAGAWALSKDGE